VKKGVYYDFYALCQLLFKKMKYLFYLTNIKQMLFCDLNVFNIMMIVEFLIFVFMSGFVAGQLFTEYDSKKELNVSENIKDLIIESQTREIKKLQKELDFTNCHIESLQYGKNENIILRPYKNN
jgi:cell division protein FtsB